MPADGVIPMRVLAGKTEAELSALLDDWLPPIARPPSGAALAAIVPVDGQRLIWDVRGGEETMRDRQQSDGRG